MTADRAVASTRAAAGSGSDRSFWPTVLVEVASLRVHDGVLQVLVLDRGRASPGSRWALPCGYSAEGLDLPATAGTQIAEHADIDASIFSLSSWQR